MKYLYALIFSLFFSSVYAAERQLQCKVVGISDGDTLTCLVNKTPLKIRLQHIDAPEQAQPYGNKAKQALAQFVFQQNITAIVSGYDRYQRLLATLYLNDKNINLALVENGMAWAYTTKREYIEAQDQAQQAKIGLWQDKFPINPSQWRKTHTSTLPQAVKKPENIANQPPTIDCQIKLSCNQIGNYAQAKRYFQQCGWKELDGNNDSIPCNKLYRQEQKNRN
ncbi:TPA: thermonuclease family protein [Mannheimia haemolytica]|uniref:Nuclease n=1 Tax=Mannheimia haemolytica TaxID=75985 RepID=A0A248ZYD4_MANHA|nr:thermonuclease family protein [Mannheimia haemolytica]AWW71077.1 nuclease [Pasteurellaceae bacterium 12565]AGI32201.1 nuclease [Mannheimia haemolytica USDA-ARS-USMARC-183]AGI35655.1 nuclease [Mannheimia haemolytica USDA-ARS-USMARC-185]AGK02969.1 putative endonuclease [Mannheimia haemolytica M42548]AGQ25066.1 nuclease [Mannheimia haemolytica D153]